MITVSILINGEPLFTRSAYRIEGSPGEICHYKCDDGSFIEHHYNAGAVSLAKKMLDTIDEKIYKKEQFIKQCEKHLKYLEAMRGIDNET